MNYNHRDNFDIGFALWWMSISSLLITDLVVMTRIHYLLGVVFLVITVIMAIITGIKIVKAFSYRDEIPPTNKKYIDYKWLTE